MKEIWKPVSGFEGSYEISNMGNLKGLYRGSALKKLRVDKDGYYKVNLVSKGKKKTTTVHLLVSEAFHGRRPEGKTTDHIDGIKLNNRASNLEYVSPRENTTRAKARGNPKSSFPGVHWCHKKWRAQITIDRVQQHLGSFKEEWDAANAYEEALRKLKT